MKSHMNESLELLKIMVLVHVLARQLHAFRSYPINQLADIETKQSSWIAMADCKDKDEY